MKLLSWISVSLTLKTRVAVEVAGTASRFMMGRTRTPRDWADIVVLVFLQHSSPAAMP